MLSYFVVLQLLYLRSITVLNLLRYIFKNYNCEEVFSSKLLTNIK